MANLLIVNHYFSQGIDSIRAVAREHNIRVVSFTFFRRAAQSVFPAPVFRGLETYWDDKYASQRATYARLARQLVHELYQQFPFDAIISPSDTFFYIRDVVAATQEMGVPFVVLQKETTISPHTMEHHACKIGTYFPFKSDFMLVCSERHKQFWLNAGAPSDKIEVIGQPRFDLYVQPHRWKTWKELGVRVAQGKRTVLFFSYDLGAYSPEGIRVGRAWKQLREETEQVLFQLAEDEDYVILVKPHPQQYQMGEHRRVQKQIGRLWGRSVKWLDPHIDTRHLIVNTDVVVGFQTTALFEAMVAGKPVLYTFWGEAVQQYAEALIPFYEMQNVLTVVRSAQHLRDAICRAVPPQEEQMSERQVVFERHLGLFDGRASQRALQRIEAVIADARGSIKPEAIAIQTKLQQTAEANHLRFILSALFQSLIWAGVAWFLPLVYPLWKGFRWGSRRSRKLPTPPYFYYKKLVQSRRTDALISLRLLCQQHFR